MNAPTREPCVFRGGTDGQRSSTGVGEEFVRPVHDGNEMTNDNQQLDLATFTSRVNPDGRPEYWRTLDQLAQDSAVAEFLHYEFPQQAAPMADGVDRRDFLRLMGASFAMAGLAACARPIEKIVPYVNMPEEVIPGKPLFFATASTFGDSGLGLLVESHMGRPTKIEGNPTHPASLGATDTFAQASVLSLYDPDRSPAVRHLGEISTYNNFLSDLQPRLALAKNSGGKGVRLLTDTIVSPTLGEQIQKFRQLYPQAVWHQFEPANRDNAREGARMVFGRYVNPVYHFDQADLVLSFDSDFLAYGPGSVRYAHDFSERRRVRSGGQASMSRVYAVESMPTSTGAIADHRIPLRASEVETFARALARQLGISVEAGEVPASAAAMVGPIAADLRKHAGRVIVIAGDHQSPAVHAIAHSMNGLLGGAGKTVTYTEPIEVEAMNQGASLAQLVQEMNAGQVETLLIMNTNPVFDAPADLRFADAMKKVRFRAQLSLYYDETSELCDWHVPATHFLEHWSDTRAYDGTAAIVQPLIAPLYNGRSPHEAARGDDRRCPRAVRDRPRSLAVARRWDGVRFDVGEMAERRSHPRNGGSGHPTRRRISPLSPRSRTAGEISS